MGIKKYKSKILIAIGTIMVIIAALAIYAIASMGNVEYKPYQGSNYISPANIAIVDGNTYVADATKGNLYRASISGKDVDRTWDAEAPVNGVMANGTNVFALSGERDGKLTKLNANLDNPASADTVYTGHTPVAAVVVGSNIYVANRFSGTVTVHNLSDLEKTKTIDVGREPISMAVVGANIYVARHLPDGAFDADDPKAVNSSDVIVINTATNEVSKTIPLINGTSAVKDIVASPDGKYLYVSGTIGRYSYPLTQLDRAWLISNGINIIDVEKQELFNAVLLDQLELGAANPWGLGVAQNGNLVASIAATNEAIIINTTGMFDKIKDVAEGKNRFVRTVDAIPNYLPFLDGVRTRVKLDGTGPRALVMNENKAYICQYFTGNIAVVDVAADIAQSSQNLNETISLGTQPEVDQVRYGEMLWNDGTATYQQWLSCASCHPDARMDALNWAPGITTHMNTKAMTFSERTPPIQTRGGVPTTYDGIVGSYKFDNYGIYSKDQMDAVYQYLKYLTPAQSPYRERDGSLTDSAERGKVLFEANCASCHPAPLYTDLKFYSPTWPADNWEKDTDVKYITPSLVETWRNGPWFGSGKAGTLKQAVEKSLEKANKTLTNDEIADLTNFVGSIGTEEEIYAVDMVTFVDELKTKFLVKPPVDQSFIPELKLSEVTILKQWATDKQAEVTITLYKANGTVIGTPVSGTLKANMAINEKAILNPNITVPADFAKGDYYVISITEVGGTAKLATDYKIVY